MRKVYFYGAISLDGYLAGEHEDLQWLFNTDLAGKFTYEQFEPKIDTLVMGNTTYKETKKMLNGQPFYPKHNKIIFSRTQTGQFPSGYYTNQNPVQTVTQLKQQNGLGIWIVGGGAIVTQLVQASLIDELWIQIAPILLGKGKRLFIPGNYQQRFDLVETTQLGELTELHLKLK
ncbi:dihydrofolate reductase family protein [Paucilactobacillus sp. N302-9]